MANEDSDILKEFQEFLTQRQEAERAQADSEDFEVEIFDEKGRGVRTRRSHAKPFLQSLGLDIDATETDSGTDNNAQRSDGASGNTKSNTKGNSSSKAAPQASTGVARRYFTRSNPTAGK